LYIKVELLEKVGLVLTCQSVVEEKGEGFENG